MCAGDKRNHLYLFLFEETEREGANKKGANKKKGGGGTKKNQEKKKNFVMCSTLFVLFSLSALLFE